MTSRIYLEVRWHTLEQDSKERKEPQYAELSHILEDLVTSYVLAARLSQAGP